MSNPKTLKPFKKGKDPRRNVTGANRGSKWLTTRLEEALREKAKGSNDPYYELLIKRELNNAIVKGDQRAIEHIWDRIEGKVTLPIAHSGEVNDEASKNINKLNEEIKEFLRHKHLKSSK